MSNYLTSTQIVNRAVQDMLYNLDLVDEEKDKLNYYQHVDPKFTITIERNKKPKLAPSEPWID